MKKSNKPRFVSHYLVLIDLLAGKDVRMYSDSIYYLTARIENIKLDLVKQGLKFIEDVKKETSYSYYKPYILVPSDDNIKKAKELMAGYGTKEVLEFLEISKKSS